ncbi:hypothetical protein CARUB_v10018726mg [Capsella rubella]|uniref:Uncharacterized protein n=1 Tax=Capsella rubella TaxID=81985 RepID=R0H7V1_9BRAS|nr:hypothetical protein CARUB_v10018726mg [Capsella rubella]
MHALPSQSSRISFLFIPIQKYLDSLSLSSVSLTRRFIPSQQIENPFPRRNNACTTKPIILFFSFPSNKSDFSLLVVYTIQQVTSIVF